MSFDFKISQGDFVLGQDGDFQKVTDIEKLVQEILKILMTPLGANVFFPWYGSPLTDVSIGQVADRTFAVTMVQQIISSNMETLQKMQKQQAASGQRVSASELLAAVSSINVHRNTTDPTYWTVAVRVLSKGLKSANAVLDISL